jgi:hypothetical protein
VLEDMQEAAAVQAGTLLDQALVIAGQGRGDRRGDRADAAGTAGVARPQIQVEEPAVPAEAFRGNDKTVRTALDGKE